MEVTAKNSRAAPRIARTDVSGMGFAATTGRQRKQIGGILRGHTLHGSSAVAAKSSSGDSRQAAPLAERRIQPLNGRRTTPPSSTPGRNISRHGMTKRIQRHLSINTAVTEFKTKIGNTALVTRGQFYWSHELKSVIKTNYQSILNSSWSGAAKHTLQNDLDSMLVLAYDPKGKAVPIARLRRKIFRFLAASSNTTAPQIRKIVGTGYYRTKKHGTSLFRRIWNRYRRALAIPNLGRHARIDKLQGLATFEDIACWSAAERVAKFFVAKGGHSISTRSRGKKIIGSSLCRRVRRHNASVGVYKKGDVVLFHARLGPMIAKVKSAIDDGYHIHARVLSGIDSGATPRCKQEHSINIVGYDANKFVFWDPDTAASVKFGGGFGYLYYDSTLRRFTTAQNDADMRVSSRGNHMTGAQHRYQVLTIRTI